MWFESQNCAMMGLQQTASKRKLEAATAPSDLSSPPKSGRWEADDCIARLRAVAVPGESSWRPPTPATTTTTTAATVTTFLSDDFVDDDDDFDDDLSSDDDRFPTPPTTAAAAAITPPYSTTNPEYHHHWQWYQAQQQQQQQQQQQTIRREENGKSYFELGASPPSLPPLTARQRCCDGRTRWCNVPCYRQRRLAVLNMSMCKLARYRQCSDPSLRRSVLICNTLRRLEREMESEPPPEITNYPPLPELTPPSRPLPVVQEQQTTTTTTINYEQSLREMTCSSGRATPFPTQLQDTDSGIGDDDDVDDDTTKPINWGSVLSLSSQTDLELLNNNELYAELGLSNSETMEWKDSSSGGSTNEWDGFMHVLVGGS